MEWTQEGRLKFIKVGTDGNLDRYNKEYVLAYVKWGTIVPIWVAPQKFITAFVPLSRDKGFFYYNFY